MSKFSRALKTLLKMIINTPQKPMTLLTDDENRKQEKSNDCHICNKKFIYEKENEKYHERKKRYHFHYTGN